MTESSNTASSEIELEYALKVSKEKIKVCLVCQRHSGFLMQSFGGVWYELSGSLETFMRTIRQQEISCQQPRKGVVQFANNKKWNGSRVKKIMWRPNKTHFSIRRFTTTS